MNNKRVLVGLSGGVDSLVATLRLKEQGFEPVGITFIFYGEPNPEFYQKWKGIAKRLGIEHHIVDVRKAFEKHILSYFVEEYLKGKTPFPCALCNLTLKWNLLDEHSEKLNCTYVSTGHYALVKEYQGRKVISIHEDEDKDQSFFLWGVKESILKKTLFPLHDLKKSEVKAYAEEHGYESFSKQKESTGACFAVKNDYRTFLSDYLPNPEILDTPGSFIDNDGIVLGQHKGITNYTVGQRRGLGIHLNKPVFVSEIRPKENQVVLSDFKSLYKQEILIENYKIDSALIDETTEYEIRIRYRNQSAIGTLHQCNDKVLIKLKEPEYAIAPGQTAVIYKEDYVLGGGFIL